ncbi:Methane monooxygenase component A gamma chain [Methylovirgula sp. HY1]|nr:Methane monooxygenase component A gamma chain [Methylovirgula sp. HY1]
MPNYKIHANPVRSEWLEKIGDLKSVKDATAFIQDFRVKNTGPFRTTYALNIDYLFIEAKIEERLAVLKASTFSAVELFSKATTGEAALAVADSYIAKMEAEKCKFAAEKILITFRQLYKPPVLPVNVFFKVDAHLGSRLMELRNTDYYAESLEELRKKRGVKVLKLGNAA